METVNTIPHDTTYDGRRDGVLDKVAQYFSTGTCLVWVVLPKTHTVFVYHSLHDVRSFGPEDELSG
ncbi:MAG: hypothetical protein AB7G75_35750 [Candidatus Binatia bacterium]